MLRKIKKIVAGEEKVDGAGVSLTRVIGKPNVHDFDPFLMLDAFDHKDPEKYTKGFPWHPHRGIETVTYLLEGEIEHGDSLGNSGVIRNGDCQWMTAGSGIIHQEMPQAAPRMLGTQLWVNLPAKDKMTVPKYRDFKNTDLPQINSDNCRVKIIAGQYDGRTGPMEDITVQPTYLDVTVKPGAGFTFETDPHDTLFIYIYSGTLLFKADRDKELPTRVAALFEAGDELHVKGGEKGARFLLFAGKPLKEPIAWGGPIVMNTKDELALAFEEINKGTFIKEHQPDGSVTSSKVHEDYYR